MKSDLPSRLVIVGASARAAATLSGVKDLHTCDLFADHDLCQVANADRIPGDSFPHGFEDWTATKKVAGPCDQDSGGSRGSGWMYTGGLENYPDLVDRISTHHELLGCSGDILNAVRDPLLVSEVINQARMDRVQSPPVSMLPFESSDRVLRKPLKSCGGLGIQEVAKHDPKLDVRDQTHYYQQSVEGVPHAGLFLANGKKCRLLGVTRSWVDHSGRNAFRYGGSVGPIRLDEKNDGDSWLRLGLLLSKQFEIRGLFGVDAIVTTSGEIAPLEINPRFTASMELLPKIEERTVVEWHIATCRTGVLPSQNSCRKNPDQGMAGKGILYAPEFDQSGEPIQLIEWTDELRQRLSSVAANNDATLADLPANGETISGGHPMLTVLVHGDDPKPIQSRLSWSRGQLFDLIWKGNRGEPVWRQPPGGFAK